jgi:hypothetical protein
LAGGLGESIGGRKGRQAAKEKEKHTAADGKIQTEHRTPEN